MLDPLTGLAPRPARSRAAQLPGAAAAAAARELAAITDRFNALAQALDAARAENIELNQRLITAQDDERRRTALELHDEVGPCLFGLKANAASIATGRRVARPAARKVAERARDMLAIVDHLQAINRSLLNRLRPMALGHVPLRDLLAELVQDRARQHPEIAFRSPPGALAAATAIPIDLTVYRCIQESLTNAIRHAGRPCRHRARRVTPRPAAARLELPCATMAAASSAAPQGFGLRGMQERVQALGGAFSLDGRPGGGTCVRIVMPASPAAERRRRMTSVLIIDDHPIVLQGCRRVLEDAGIATGARGARHRRGLSAYRRHRPDVVIVDLAMQGERAWRPGLIRRIRRTTRARASSCSACTATR